MLLAELHAHAFEQFAAAASDRAADLSMWVWQLVAVTATTMVSRVVLTRFLAHTGLNHQPIQSLPFQSIELTLWQSAPQNVSTPKLVTAWAVIVHKVQGISLHQGVNILGGIALSRIRTMEGVLLNTMIIMA